jgi:hypothetical protein
VVTGGSVNAVARVVRLVRNAYVDGVVLRKILETITIAAGFGAICVWLHVNRIAFDLDKGRRRG